VLDGEKSQPINKDTSGALLATSLPIWNGTEETVRGGTIHREPTTTGVAVKRLSSLRRSCKHQSLLIPGAPVSSPENARN